MLAKELRGLPVYPLSPSQDLITLMYTYSIHKNAAQIPVYLLIDRKLDHTLLEKAMNIEIERNDCLRMYLFKEKGAIQQVFRPSVPEVKITTANFSGKTKEEMLDVFRKDARQKMGVFKGELYRIIHFTAYDGRDGIYINACHLFMDLLAILLFLQDLMWVYSALEKGTDLPKPLDSFEESLKRDLALAANQKKTEKDEAFFKALYQEQPHGFYSGVDAMRELNKKRRKHPDQYWICSFDPFHDKTAEKIMTVDGQTMKGFEEYAELNGLAMQSMLLTAMDIYLSAVNDRSLNVTSSIMVSRRTKLADLNCCGVRVNTTPFKIVFDEKDTFSEAVNKVTKKYLSIIRHIDYSGRQITNLGIKYGPKGFTASCTSMCFTYMPETYLNFPKDMEFELGGISPGNFCHIEYVMICPDLKGNTCFLYQYMPHRFTEADQVRMHENTINILKAASKGSEMTVGQLMDIVQ